MHGSVLKVTRQDTLQDIERHFNTMKENGLDTAVIWPSSFWWEEKKKGYPFNTGKEILKIAEKVGISIIMELAGQLSAMEYIPDFLMKKEYYAVDNDGNVLWGQSSFGFLNYFHPEVSELICSHFEKTARAYKDFSALYAYDIFNETMFRSFDKYTMAEFQKWLKKKYGTLEKLNDVWERTYSQWEQIDFQSWKWMSIMPEADYADFRKESIGLFVKKWYNSVKSIDTKHLIIADNIHSMVTIAGNFERPQDDFDLADTVDKIGMSFYPKGVNGCMEPALRWQIFSGFFAASKREGFILSEMQTHTQALFNPMTEVKPYELKQWCLEALSGGADTLIYWMWRPFTKGLQTLGRGLIDHKERPTPRLDVAKEISGIITDIGHIKPMKSEVAVLYDDLSENFQYQYTKAYNVDQNIYLNSIFGAYKVMFDNNIQCDIIKLDEIYNYKLVFLSNYIVIDEHRANVLKKYVENGGIIICDGKFGVCDTYSMLNKNLPGGELYSYVGQDYIDMDFENADFVYNGEKVQGYYGRDLMEQTTGSVLSVFDDGNPAFVKNVVGKGCIISINTHIWYGYAKRCDNSVKNFVLSIFAEFGVDTSYSNSKIKVRNCINENGEYAFLFNYTYETQQILLDNKNITINAHDVKIVKRDARK